MRTVTAAVGDLERLLTAAGFGSVSPDPAEVNPNPAGVWLQPRGVTDVTLAGDGGTLTVWAYLIVANVDTRQAMRLLDDALAGVLEADVALADDDAVDLAAAVVLPHTANPLPAYRVALTLEL